MDGELKIFGRFSEKENFGYFHGGQPFMMFEKEKIGEEK